MRILLRRWWFPVVVVGFLFMALPTPSDAQAFTHLDSVLVVPNPYVVSGRTFGPKGVGGATSQGYERISFRNLPNKCTLKVYTSAGNFVTAIEHSGGSFAEWDGRNSDNQYIVSDVYILLIESSALGDQGDVFGRKVIKFIVIR